MRWVSSSVSSCFEQPPATKAARVNAQKVDATPIELSPSLEKKVEEAADKAAIQLVPKKPSLWQRIKFLFTGKLD